DKLEYFKFLVSPFYEKPPSPKPGKAMLPALNPDEAQQLQQAIIAYLARRERIHGPDPLLVQQWAKWLPGIDLSKPKVGPTLIFQKFWNVPKADDHRTTVWANNLAFAENRVWYYYE